MPGDDVIIIRVLIKMQEQEKKRLLITASTFPRYVGDTEPRFILDLAVELQKYFQVTVLVPAAPDAESTEVLEGIRVERYHYFPVHRLETLCYPGAIVPRIREKKVRALLVPFLFAGLYYAIWKRRKDYDYVHAHWIIPQGIVQSLFSMPYLLTGHGGDVTSLNRNPVKYLKKRAIRRAERFTVVSEALKIEALGLFAEKEQEQIASKIAVQPMGCQSRRFGVAHRRSNYWNQGEERVVLFVGRLAEKKGVAYLIEAMQWIEGKLVIVGDGPLKGELVKQAHQLLPENKVLFMGARSHEELPVIYASADVFAAPSVTAKDKDKEGFGLVILEAMASGLPVAAFASGGITEIIRHEENGLLAQERDSAELACQINRLLYDEELRSRIIGNMNATVRLYDYEAVGKRYAELMQSRVRM